MRLQHLSRPLAWALMALAGGALAGEASAPAGLKTVFDQAWQRQPEAQAEAMRRQAAQAEQQAAQGWSPEPAALSLEAKTDRWQRNQGSREYTLGVQLPLWLPGERARRQALSAAEFDALTPRRRAAQLALAANVRQAWWVWQRARSDRAQAQAQQASAAQLAADVARRFAAGDMARTELLQAQASVAQADAALAQAEGAQQAAQAQLAPWLEAGASRSLATLDERTLEPEPLPDAAAQAPAAEHPLLADAQAQAQLARRSAELASVQRRANPQLALSTATSRDAFGARYDQSLTLGITVPLGAGARADAKQAAALALALEAETRVQQETQRLAAEQRAAQARWQAAQAQQQALAQQAQLAQQTRAFVAQAFAAGEADWPTRLRAEQDASSAQRQAARARIDAAAALSELRQALGLLPE